MALILLPSSSREFSWVRWEKTLAGTVVIMLWAKINESKLCKPAKKEVSIKVTRDMALLNSYPQNRPR